MPDSACRGRADARAVADVGADRSSLGLCGLPAPGAARWGAGHCRRCVRRSARERRGRPRGDLRLPSPPVLSGSTSRPDRYSERRALLEGLGLAGVVAKRLSSMYIPGRRPTAWVKHKLGREERIPVIAVRPTSDTVAEAVFVARAARRFVGRLRLRRAGLGTRPNRPARGAPRPAAAATPRLRLLVPG